MGGYNAIDTAKCWIKITSIAANICLSNDVPYHCNFDKFAPHYHLNKVINTNNQCNELNDNKRSYIYAIQNVYAHLNKFERLFIQNLKQNCIKNEIAMKEIMKNMNQKKINDESKEIEDIQTKIIEPQENDEGSDDNDKIVQNQNNDNDINAII